MLRLVRRLFLFCLLAACTRNEEPPAFRLRIGAVGTLERLSPKLVGGFSTLINPLVFQPIASPSRERFWNSLVLEPLEPQGPRLFRFKLKPGTAFSDGTALSADDVARSVAGKGTVRRDGEWHILELAEGTGAEDLLEAEVSKSSDSGTLGTGPFTVVSQEASAITLRRRVPDARRISQVELTRFGTPRDAFAAALRGEINLVVMPTDAQTELLSGVRTLRVIRGQGLHSLAVVFNTRRLDLNSRRALAHSMERDDIASAYGPSCRPRASTRSAKLPQGSALDIVAFDAFQGLRLATLALQRSLGGRSGRVKSVPILEAREEAVQGEFDLLMLTVQTWPTELALARWVTGAEENWGGYSNPKFDSAFRAGDFVRAQAELDADPPAAFICDLDRTAIVDSRLKNATLGDYDLLDTLPEWEVSP